MSVILPNLHTIPFYANSVDGILFTPPSITTSLLPQGGLGRGETPLYDGRAQVVRWSESLIAWGSAKAVTVSGSGSRREMR